MEFSHSVFTGSFLLCFLSSFWDVGLYFSCFPMQGCVGPGKNSSPSSVSQPSAVLKFTVGWLLWECGCQDLDLTEHLSMYWILSMWLSFSPDCILRKVKVFIGWCTVVSAFYIAFVFIKWVSLLSLWMFNAVAEVGGTWLSLPLGVDVWSLLIVSGHHGTILKVLHV